MTTDGNRFYECRICGSKTEVYQYRPSDREIAVEICTDCWFAFLTGTERKAIAERMDNAD